MSNQYVRGLAVVAVVVMVAAATPATVLAGTATFQHTTTSDFENGSLNGVLAAADQLSAGGVDTFEDGDLTIRNDLWSDWSGDTGSFSVVSKYGGQAAELNVASGTTQLVRTDSSGHVPTVTSASVEVDTKASGSEQELAYWGNSNGADQLQVKVNHTSGDIELVNYVNGQENSVTTLLSGWQANTKYDIRIAYNTSAESVDVYVDGSLTASNVDISNNELWQNGVSRIQLTSQADGADINTYVDDVYLWSNNPTNNTYVSANYTKDQVINGTTDVSTLSDADATITWEGYDGSTWSTIDSTTYTTAGEKTVSLSGTSYEKYRVRVTYDATGANPQGVLASDSITIDNSAPDVDNSSANPASGEKVSDRNVNLSIDVSDDDFASGNEELTAEFYVDGTSVGTDTITSNGTVSTTTTVNAGGEHSWYVEVTDKDGVTTTSDTFTFNAPGTLYLYNETNTSQLVKTQTPVEIRFFGEQQTITETTTDGTVNLSSENVSVPFIVQVEETDNYHSRTVYIRDIYSQQSVYLLNKSVASVNLTFILDDPTGEFGAETTVYIKKPINDSGNTVYKTIVADRFGVEGVSATLEQGQRYRIVVRSPDGDVQQIGPYRAERSETVTVEPGAPSVKLSNRSTNWDTGAGLTNQTLEVRYLDSENLTSEVTIYIHERGNTSNQLAPNQTYQNPSDLSVTYSLTANESEKEWQVNYIIDRDGETIRASEVASNTEDLTPNGLAPGWVQIFGVGAIILTAGLFSEVDAHLGALATPAVAGLMWFTGFLSGVATLGAVTMAMFVGVLVYARGSTRGV